MLKFPEKYRTSLGVIPSLPGHNGLFVIPLPDPKAGVFCIIASNGMGWEHVSAHVLMQKRIGTHTTLG
jgi:hypothetical protein